MTNLVFIGSIIKPPNWPLMYTSVRSVYTPLERFEDTKKTIQSVRNKIPNSVILLVECSELTEDENNYFRTHCEHVINLFDDAAAKSLIYSPSKSLGEATMTSNAIAYIKKHQIPFQHFFKISGRYWLNDKFIYLHYDNDHIIIRLIYNDPSNVATTLYKLPSRCLDDLSNFLSSNIKRLMDGEGYERVFATFIHEQLSKKEPIVYIEKLGVCGYVSVANDFYDY
jgi:hypothetical protein